MIEFHLDGRSPVTTYKQLVQQVRQALRVGLLEPGDQLPRVREVAESLAINPPAERFWLFQGIETALFVALAVLLLAAVYWVRRRIS